MALVLSTPRPARSACCRIVRETGCARRACPWAACGASRPRRGSRARAPARCTARRRGRLVAAPGVSASEVSASQRMMNPLGRNSLKTSSMTPARSSSSRRGVGRERRELVDDLQVVQRRDQARARRGSPSRRCCWRGPARSRRRSGPGGAHGRGRAHLRRRRVPVRKRVEPHRIWSPRRAAWCVRRSARR